MRDHSLPPSSHFPSLSTKALTTRGYRRCIHSYPPACGHQRNKGFVGNTQHHKDCFLWGNKWFQIEMLFYPLLIVEGAVDKDRLPGDGVEGEDIMTHCSASPDIKHLLGSIHLPGVHPMQCNHTGSLLLVHMPTPRDSPTHRPPHAHVCQPMDVCTHMYPSIRMLTSVMGKHTGGHHSAQTQGTAYQPKTRRHIHV